MLLHVQTNLLIKVKLYQNTNKLKNHTSQLLETLKSERYNDLLKDNIQGFDVTDMQLISEYKKRINCSLCAVDS